MQVIAIITVYIVGVCLSFAMQRTEFESEKVPYTKGLRLLCYSLSIFSWLMVMYLLIAAWIELIGKAGYWSNPANEKPETDKQ